MNKIEDSIVIKGESVTLFTLEEKHFSALHEIAEDTRIWEFIPTDMSGIEQRQKAFSQAVAEKANGSQMPFVIFHNREKKIIGSTRLMEIFYRHQKLEIGWTWMHPDYWATEVNLECKLLLLTFCFEQLNVSRVQLKTDEKNIRSQKAIQKIGAQYEGTLRQDMIKDNGSKRNSVYFSMLDHEWQDKKVKLKARWQQMKLINQKQKSNAKT